MEKLLKTALAISLLGILLLLFLSTKLQTPLTTINQSLSLEEYEKVKLEGQVLNFRELSPNFYILGLKDSTSEIDIVFNSKNNLSQLIKNNNTLMQITGKINFYNNKTQINADKIVLLKNAT
ncbi:hypothetical protein FJZ17_00275 [Candidatus Pacearchaeota archaeon]|nr:hypothetical protein [Candidatus Pacearchaeota archaeon]